MKKSDWSKLIASLPPGLTIKAAAEYLGQNYAATRLWIINLKYEYADGRSQAWPVARRQKFAKVNPDRMDWSQSNVALAGKHKLSRERVRQIRSARNNHHAIEA